MAETLGATVFVKNVHRALFVAVEDGVDGVFAGNVFDLAAAQVVGCGEGGALVRRERWNHRVPDLLAHGGVGLLEADLVEESLFCIQR